MARSDGRTATVSKPARIWLGTIPYSVEYDLNHRLNTNESIAFSCGQQEIGASGYHHWQIIIYFKAPVRLSAITKIFGSGSHWEPTRSAAAEQYVNKEETAVAGSQFIHGTKPIKRNSNKDWDKIRDDAKCGRLDDIPADIYIRRYPNLKHYIPNLKLVTSPSVESNQTILNQLLSNEKFSASGEVLVVESHDVPGKKQLWRHTLRILALNSGTDIEAMRMWSSMNSVVESTSATFSDGSTDIRLLLR